MALDAAATLVDALILQYGLQNLASKMTELHIQIALCTGHTTVELDPCAIAETSVSKIPIFQPLRLNRRLKVTALSRTSVHGTTRYKKPPKRLYPVS